LFLVCMVAYYPGIASEALPSDFLLQRLELPLFHLLFQIMIFSALLESGTGAVHAINERIAKVLAPKGKPFGRVARLLVAGIVLVLSVFVAAKFGLVVLIARGYRFLALLFATVYILPMVTYGTWRIYQARNSETETANSAATS